MAEEETLFTLIVDQDEEDTFFADCAELKGIYGQDQTMEEALRDAERGLDIALDYYTENQMHIPLRKLVKEKKVVKTTSTPS
ncbi:MAG: type II toxin-antitoxin system HicB family antitoxin [Candidatus Heimdallarchaeota archaeon]